MKNNEKKNKNRKKQGKNFDEENLLKVSGGVGDVAIREESLLSMEYGGPSIIGMNSDFEAPKDIENSNSFDFNRTKDKK